MRRIHIAFVLAICASFTLSVASAGPAAFSEVTDAAVQNIYGAQGAQTFTAIQPMQGQVDGVGVDSLTWFTSRSDFDTECGGGVLVEEDFEGTTLGPGQIQVCANTLNCTTGCPPLYPPNSVVCDFQLSTLTELVVLTAGSLPGVSSAVVGPNFFAENLTITFTGADPVFAAGFVIIDTGIFGLGQWNITAFNGATNLGSQMTNYGFIGVVSDPDPITRIEIVGVPPLFDGELIDNLVFGTCEPGGPPPPVGNCNLEPIEAKLDVMEPKLDDLGIVVDDIATEVGNISVAVDDLTDAVAAVEGKLDAGGGGACEVVRLLTAPALPKGPRLPDTHPCFVPQLGRGR